MMSAMCGRDVMRALVGGTAPLLRMRYESSCLYWKAKLGILQNVWRLQMMMSPIKGNLNLERGNDSGLPRTLSDVERLHSMTLERLPACA